MKETFVLTGAGRAGTFWLTQQLNKHTNAVVGHDEFMPRNFVSSAKRWRESDGPIGTASGVARYCLPFLWKEFKPKIAFLWREPLSLVRSHVELQLRTNLLLADEECQPKILELGDPLGRFIARTAHVLFGDLEVSLALCRRLEIPVVHWDMKDYTSKEGFTGLAAWLGLRCDSEALDGPTNALAEYRCVPHPDKWAQDVRQYVLDAVRALPGISAGYKAAADSVPVLQTPQP